MFLIKIKLKKMFKQYCLYKRANYKTDVHLIVNSKDNMKFLGEFKKCEELLLFLQTYMFNDENKSNVFIVKRYLNNFARKKKTLSGPDYNYCSKGKNQYHDYHSGHNFGRPFEPGYNTAIYSDVMLKYTYNLKRGWHESAYRAPSECDISNHDYADIQTRCLIIKKELMKNRFHPNNISKFRGWGINGFCSDT